MVNELTFLTAVVKVSYCITTHCTCKVVKL